jgi:hypothetical protein
MLYYYNLLQVHSAILTIVSIVALASYSTVTVYNNRCDQFSLARMMVMLM